MDNDGDEDSETLYEQLQRRFQGKEYHQWGQRTDGALVCGIHPNEIKDAPKITPPRGPLDEFVEVEP